MKRKNKFIFGITGGIATGKSTAAEFFRSKGYPVVDADQMGHEIIERENVKAKLTKKFGNNVLNNANINREKLGKIVFNDEKKLRALNNIVHPELIYEIKKEVKKLDDDFIFIDAALLLDWEMEEFCDYVILIVSERKKKIQRLRKYRKHTRNEAKLRIDAQHFAHEKADFVISNNFSIKEFKIKLNKVLNKLKKARLK